MKNLFVIYVVAGLINSCVLALPTENADKNNSANETIVKLFQTEYAENKNAVLTASTVIIPNTTQDDLISTIFCMSVRCNNIDISSSALNFGQEFVISARDLQCTQLLIANPQPVWLK